jgi:hypothetical protein
MSEQEKHDTEEARQAPSQGRETRRGDEAHEASWDSYSLEILHALDD